MLRAPAVHGESSLTGNTLMQQIFRNSTEMNKTLNVYELQMRILQLDQKLHEQTFNCAKRSIHPALHEKLMSVRPSVLLNKIIHFCERHLERASLKILSVI